MNKNSNIFQEDIKVPELLENIIILFHKACFLVLYISNKTRNQDKCKAFFAINNL